MSIKIETRVSKTRNPLILNDEFCSGPRLEALPAENPAEYIPRPHLEGGLVAICIQNDEFRIKNDGFCFENDEFRIKNDGFCIKNDDFNANVQGRLSELASG